MSRLPPGEQAAIGTLLRLEWLALAVGAVGLYLVLGGDPLWIVPLLLAPDLSMVGYLAGPRVGALAYNAVHNIVLPMILLALGWLLPAAWLALAGAVVLAHVGADRLLGYGLKLPSGFRETHLGRIGR